MISLDHVRDWVFDMDDTLYPPDQGVMRLVQGRINAFMVDAVGLPADEARVLQRQFLDEHGTTLAGLMANYAVDPEQFLREVHDVPLDSLEPNPRLAELLRELPGRRFVLTNGARCHAARVLERIGVADLFDGVFCIEDMDLVPKPAPATFRRFLDRYAIDPRHAVFFDDTPKNLLPAKALGMTTVLTHEGLGRPLVGGADLTIGDLTAFLEDLLPTLSNARNAA